jgi:hypothetical protein
MIPILVAVLMQAGGAYTHLPKLTLFPQYQTAPAIASLVKPEAVAGRCSVHMPRMAIPKDVEFHIDTIKPAVIVEPTVTVPAPECPAPKSQK